MLHKEMESNFDIVYVAVPLKSMFSNQCLLQCHYSISGVGLNLESGAPDFQMFVHVYDNLFHFSSFGAALTKWL